MAEMQANVVGRVWRRMGGPEKIGLFFGLLGAALVVIGLLRGTLAQFSWQGLLIGVLVGGGSWGLVSWAIATAAVEVERDVAEAEEVNEAKRDEGKSDLAEHGAEAQGKDE